jgi:hypothetical protein
VEWWIKIILTVEAGGDTFTVGSGFIVGVVVGEKTGVSVKVEVIDPVPVTVAVIVAVGVVVGEKYGVAVLVAVAVTAGVTEYVRVMLGVFVAVVKTVGSGAVRGITFLLHA